MVGLMLVWYGHIISMSYYDTYSWFLSEYNLSDTINKHKFFLLQLGGYTTSIIMIATSPSRHFITHTFYVVYICIFQPLVLYKMTA